MSERYKCTLLDVAIETATWCERAPFSAPPNYQVDLNQLLPVGDAEINRCRAARNFYDLLNVRPSVVEVIANARAERLAERADAPDPSALRRGRILIFNYSDSLYWGLAEPESEGFFDASECPPADTWIAAFHYRRRSNSARQDGFLVTWISNALVPLAEAGINVDPTDPWQWLDDPVISDPDLRVIAEELIHRAPP